MNEEINTLPLEQLLSHWNKSNVSYCVWKGSSKIDSAIQGEDDLDVLVVIENSNEAEKIAKKLGFLNLLPEKYRSDIGTKDFYFYSPIQQKWFHLHIHYQLIFGNGVVRNYHLPIEREVLSTRIWNEKYQFWSISPEDDLCLFVIRHCLRKEIYGKYTNFQSEYNQLLFHYKNKIDNELPKYYPESACEYVTQIVGGVKPSVSNLRKKLLDDLFPNKQKTNFFTTLLPRITKKAYLKLMKLTSRRTTYGNSYLSKGGILIGFIGIDGSGKSSAIDRLSTRFSIHINTETISLGSGVSGASWYRRIAFKAFGTRAKFKGHRNARSKDNSDKVVQKKYPWYYILWLIICLYDKKQELRRGLAAKSRGSLVLSDRWLQISLDDHLDGPRTKNIKVDNFLTHYLINLEKNVFQYTLRNKPDLIIRFDISPETSIARKPHDLTLERAILAKELIESLSWETELITINANQSIEQVDLALSNIIINKIELHTN